MSDSGKPASRKRCAMASAAAVTLPTESVELISINCLKMSCESFLVASSICACDVRTKSNDHKMGQENRIKAILRCNGAPDDENRDSPYLGNRKHLIPSTNVASRHVMDEHAAGLSR